MTSGVITIDGSLGEGGGQALRTATGLAALLRKPVRVDNIRAGRPRPGLARQHLVGVKALCRLTGGHAEGLSLGSTSISFHPGPGLKTRLEVDVGTAGSVTLVIQGLILALARTESRVRMTLRGGTDVPWSPPFNYFNHVLSPQLATLGFQVSSRLIRPGFYPKGGGEIEVSFRAPEDIEPLQAALSPGKLDVRAHVLATEDLKKARVAERLVRGVRSIFPQVTARKEYLPGASTGCSLVVSASGTRTVLGADALGEKGVRAEEIGQRAARQLAESLKAGCTVDEWSADQLLPFLALAGAPSTFLAPRLTGHAKTSMEVIERFLSVRFEVLQTGNVTRVTCHPGN